MGHRNGHGVSDHFVHFGKSILVFYVGKRKGSKLHRDIIVCKTLISRRPEMLNSIQLAVKIQGFDFI